MTKSYLAESGRSLDTESLAAQQNDLLCFSHLRWHFVTQRPQHLMTRAAKSRRVFFWEEPIWLSQDGAHNDVSSGRLDVQRIQNNLWVVTPCIVQGIDADAVQRELLAAFLVNLQIERYDAWFYTPMAVSFTGALLPEVTVYDCMDELSHFRGAPIALVDREQQLFQMADLVFTGGVSLYEAKRGQHPSVHAFPSSIEREHFEQAMNGKLAEPADQAGISHPRAGFYGVVDERFDVELLADVARLRPEVHFIILGPVVKIEPTTLPIADNIHYLGSKSYGELPAYLSGWDVALLLFALNEATTFISPTKTPEYLAAGRPVVSTPIRDVVRSYGDQGLVRIAATAAEFATELDNALELPLDSWRVAVKATLDQGSWDRTWAAMDREIERVRGERVEGGVTEGSFAAHASGSAVSYLRVEALRGPRAPARTIRNESYDYLVVGAGFAGSVLVERLATQAGKRVLLVDRRDHIGGNAYDYHDESGLLVHKYGPHIFHTNSEAVFHHLSRFTTWLPYEHRVLASVDGMLLPIPINLDTINRLHGLDLDAAGMEAFLASRVEVPRAILTSEDIVLSRVGRELYEKFFRNYTRKQWGLDPSELDSAVAGRIPVRLNRDDRYFADTYQFMPEHGYTRMFERMLDHPNITTRLGVEYREVARTYRDAKVVFTGPIDEYYGFRYGALPYRSLEFRHETHDREVFQSAPVVNYPNENAFTRVTEFKYLTGQKHSKTSVVYEYPMAQGDPYYPIPRPENAALYARYKELADRDGNVVFCGRLANYKYFNMDQVVAQALQTYKRMQERESVAVPQYLAVPEPLVGSFSLLEHSPDLGATLSPTAVPLS